MGLGSQKLHLFAKDAIADSLMEPIIRYDVRLPTENLFKLELKFHEIKQGLATLELHEEIHVAVVSVIAAHYRPENARTYHPMPPESGYHPFAHLLDRFHVGPSTNGVKLDKPRRRYFKVL
jgi:hypothetical protein